MSDSSVFSSIQLTKINSNQNMLQNGESVFVRVLSKGKAGEYIVSFAGNKFSVFSQKELQTGTTFRALVAIKDSKVYLTPLETNTHRAVQKFSTGDSQALTNLSNFLQDLGLKPDTISLRLIQYFQTAGLTFNAKLAEKVRTIGLQFPGKEDEASEIALFLEHKGIQANTDTVVTLLKILYGDGSGNSEREDKDDEEQDEPSEENRIENTAINFEEKDDYLMHESLLHVMYENALNIPNKNGNLLTYVNHTNISDNHWIILPFEYGGDNHKITGSIRLLLNVSKKNTEKMVIFAFLGGKNYKVVVNCESEGDIEQRYSIKVGTDCQDSGKNPKRLCDILSLCLPRDINCTVSYSEEIFDDAIFALESLISVVKLDV